MADAYIELVFPIFHKQYPNIELCLHDYTVAEQYRLLGEQKLDIGMVMVKHKDRQGLPESQAKMYHDINWFRLSDEAMWESCLIYSKNRPPRKAGRDFIDLATTAHATRYRRSKPDCK